MVYQRRRGTTQPRGGGAATPRNASAPSRGARRGQSLDLSQDQSRESVAPLPSNGAEREAPFRTLFARPPPPPSGDLESGVTTPAEPGSAAAAATNNQTPVVRDANLLRGESTGVSFAAVGCCSFVGGSAATWFSSHADQRCMHDPTGGISCVGHELPKSFASGRRFTGEQDREEVFLIDREIKQLASVWKPAGPMELYGYMQHIHTRICDYPDNGMVSEDEDDVDYEVNELGFDD